MIVNLLSSQLFLATFASATIFFDPAPVKHSCVIETRVNATDVNTTDVDETIVHGTVVNGTIVDGTDANGTDANGTVANTRKLPPSVPQLLTEIDTTYDEQTILLKPLTTDTIVPGVDRDGDVTTITTMCVLHRWTRPLTEDGKNSKEGFYYPLGRSSPNIPAEVYPALDENGTMALYASIVPHFNYSYNGTAILENYTHPGRYGDWNHPAGRAGRKGGLEYTCGPAGNSGDHFEEGEYLCEVTLPTTSRQNAYDPVETDYINLPYYLTYYERRMSVRDEISRFLQKNTFGPREELDTLEAEYVAIVAGDAAFLRTSVADALDATLSALETERPSSPREGETATRRESSTAASSRSRARINRRAASAMRARRMAVDSRKATSARRSIKTKRRMSAMTTAGSMMKGILRAW